MDTSVIKRGHLPQVFDGQPIDFLNEDQLNALTDSFVRWYDAASNGYHRQGRGRYWLAFLVLRWTGARIGEVLLLDDLQDINRREAEIRLQTLKRSRKKQGKGGEETLRPSRIVPVPEKVVTELATYWADFPHMRGQVFRIDQGNFRRIFYTLARTAGIPKGKNHPHILRHSRAMELLRGGVPVTAVRDLLGHASLNTTAIYLRISGQEAKGILKDRGLI